MKDDDEVDHPATGATPADPERPGGPAAPDTAPEGPTAAAPGTLVRPLTPTVGPDTTLDRPIEPATDPRGTLERPVAPTADARAATPPPPPGAHAPGWTSTRTTGPTPRPRRRRPVMIATVLLAVVIAGALVLLALRPSDLQVVGVTVTPATGPTQPCDTTVDLLGTIRTNGHAGTVTYTWLRSDGSVTPPRTEQVDEGPTSVEVHLLWQITGKGRYPATATLQVSEPTATVARTDFLYDCR